MKIRDILLQFLWDPAWKDSTSQIFIYYENRGSPDDIEVCKYSQISKIGKKFFWMMSEENTEETPIPFHRIIRISNNATNQIYYSKSFKS